MNRCNAVAAWAAACAAWAATWTTCVTSNAGAAMKFNALKTVTTKVRYAIRDSEAMKTANARKGMQIKCYGSKCSHGKLCGALTQKSLEATHHFRYCSSAAMIIFLDPSDASTSYPLLHVNTLNDMNCTWLQLHNWKDMSGVSKQVCWNTTTASEGRTIHGKIIYTRYEYDEEGENLIIDS